LVDGYNVHPDKISVVYNGITDAYKPLDEARQKETRNQYTQGRPYFVFLGALHPRKNILTLVKAFDHFKSNYQSDIQLILAGRDAWHNKELFETIQRSPFTKEIHLPGYVRTADAVPLVASAAAMIYPSIYEGFGLPLVEAMACGVPVICSNVSSLPEVAGNAALQFDPMDIQKLSQHMHAITTDQNLKNELIGLGFERSKFFSWDKAAAEIYGILESAARNR